VQQIAKNIDNAKTKKWILVTGGSGFIGTNLVVELEKQGFKIVNLSAHDPIIPVKTIKLDLVNDDLSVLDEYKFDYVVHLAAVSTIKLSEGNEEETIKLNVEGTKKLLEYFKDKNLKKFIFMSSMTVYQEVDIEMTEDLEALVDKNSNAYSYSKLLAEQECQKFADEMPILIFRLANAYGPYQRVGKTPNLIPQIIWQALNKKEIEIYNGDFARDFIYVSDITDVVLKGLKSKFAGTLNLGTGMPTKVAKIAELVAKKTGVKVHDLKRKIKAPLELVPNIILIKETLKWAPKISLKDGLEKTIKYYQSNAK
jgi:UDP-glucose 4-epimerase